MSGNSVPIVIDANVLINIAEGNSQAAEAMTRHRTSGTRIYIARAAYRELVTNGRTPRSRVGYRRLLRDLDIQVAPHAPPTAEARKALLKSRVDIYDRNIANQKLPNEMDYKPHGGLEQHKGYKGKPWKQNLSSHGDVFVVAEAQSLRARLWTLDQKAAKRAKNLGVQIAQESSIPSVSGPEDILAARKMLGVARKPRSRTAAAAAGGGPVAVKPGGATVAGGRGVASRINVPAKIGGVRAGGRGGGRGGARGGGGGGIGSVMAEVMGKPDSHYEAQIKAYLDAGLQAVDTKVAERLRKLRPEMKKLQLNASEGERLFANVTVRVVWEYITAPTVVLWDLQMSYRAVENKRSFVQGHVTNVDEYTTSFEVAFFTDEELDTLRNLSGEYLEYKRRLDIPPYDEIIAEDMQVVRQEIVDILGSDTPFPY